MSPKKNDDHEARLVALETEARLSAEQKKEDSRRIREMHETLVGEGDRPGLKGRVDRLETKQKLLVQIGSGIATLLGLVAAFLGLRQH